jgi:hypothetical protein
VRAVDRMSNEVGQPSEEPWPDDEALCVRQAYPLMDGVARQEGWDDPEMDSYDRYAGGLPQC